MISTLVAVNVIKLITLKSFERNRRLKTKVYQRLFKNSYNLFILSIPLAVAHLRNLSLPKGE